MFEDNGILGRAGASILSIDSWKALSRSLSRGVAASVGDDLLRPSGLNIRGELEMVGDLENSVIRDLDRVQWFFPDY